MNIWLIVTLLLAVGLVVGNILLLKMSAKMKFEKTEPKPGDEVVKNQATDGTQKSNEHQDSNKP